MKADRTETMPIEYVSPRPSGYYVYAFELDGVVEYVGMGTGSRIYGHEHNFKKGIGQRSYWAERLAAVLDAGRTIVARVLIDGIQKGHAESVERQLIAEIGRRCLGTGTLYNLHPGGRTSDPEAMREMALIPFVNQRIRERTREAVLRQPESQAARQKTMQKYYRDPAYKAGLSQRALESNGRPEVKAKQSEGMARAHRERRLAAAHFGVSRDAVTKAQRAAVRQLLKAGLISQPKV
jgi:hypothetical protein